MRNSKGVQQAFISGVFAAGAAIFSKFVAGAEDPDNCQLLINLIVTYIDGDHEFGCYYGPILLRSVCLAMVFLCTFLMWKTYTRSLDSSTSFAALSINSVSNLLTTAVVGTLLSGEGLNGSWFASSVVITFGLFVADALPGITSYF